jgi:hypothetical protein
LEGKVKPHVLRFPILILSPEQVQVGLSFREKSWFGARVGKSSLLKLTATSSKCAVEGGIRLNISGKNPYHSFQARMRLTN